MIIVIICTPSWINFNKFYEIYPVLLIKFCTCTSLIILYLQIWKYSFRFLISWKIFFLFCKWPLNELHYKNIDETNPTNLRRDRRKGILSEPKYFDDIVMNERELVHASHEFLTHVTIIDRVTNSSTNPAIIVAWLKVERKFFPLFMLQSVHRRAMTRAY